MMNRYKVRLYVGVGYNADKIEKDLNEMDEAGYKPQHIDTQEAYCAIVWETKS